MRILDMRDGILKACALYFKAQIEKHRINVENLLRNSVGVAEHPDIMDTIEKEIDKIADYDDKLVVLNKYFSINNEDKEVING
jgi:hypothetical protein